MNHYLIHKTKRCSRAAQAGFTLLEMMITVGIVAVLAAFAIPAYNNYVDTSEEGALMSSMATIEVFQEDFRLRTGAYAVDQADKATILATIGWDPRDNNTYSIADTAATSYSLTGTNTAGVSVCMVFPAKTRC